MAKKYFNVDLETSGNLDVGGDISLNESNHVGTRRLVYPGTDKLWLEHSSSNGNVGVVLDSHNTADANVSKFRIFERNADTLTDVFNVDESGNVQITGNLDLDENKSVSANRLSYPGTDKLWIEHSSSNGNVAVMLDSHNTADANVSKFRIFERNADTLTDVFNVDESGNVQADGNLEVGGNVQITGNLFNVDESGNVQADGNLQVEGQIRTNDIRPIHPGDTIDLGDKILVDTISPNGSGGAGHTTVKITNDADDTDNKAITLQVVDSANTSARIQVGEMDSSTLTEAGETDILMGCSIYYKGSSTGDNKVHIGGTYKDSMTLGSGVEFDYEADQDVLSFDRDGSDVKLESTDNLNIDSGGFLILNPTNGLTITGITQETNAQASLTHDLTIDGFGAVRYAQGTAFTGTHAYKSTSTIEAGVAVTLSDTQELVICSSSNLTTCVGIVTRSLGNFPGDFIVDSFGTKHAEDRDYYILEVAAVGDSRHKGCQGFNVCNENGDIQPGDLLVTSSTPGYLMKQDDDIMRSKTVGKVMEAVTFDDNGQATGVYGFIYCG